MATLADPLQNYPTELVQRAGRSIWRAFRRWAELEDCQQEAWVAYFTYRKEFDKRLGDGEDWYVAKAIRNHVADWCRAQKAIQCGYDTTDEHFYSRRRVRVLLEYFLVGEPTPKAGPKPEGRVRTATTDGTDSQVELLDVGRAWGELDNASRDALMLAYGPWEVEPGTYGEPERRAARRALGRLVDILNGTA